VTGGLQDEDADARALERVLASRAPAREWFEPQFLQRYPLRIVQGAVRLFLDRHGALVRVERDGELWRAHYERGEEPVIARFAADGRIAGLGIGPAAEAAEADVPYREWPRSVVRRRLAVPAVLSCVAPPAYAAAVWTEGTVLGWVVVAVSGAVFCAFIWAAAPWYIVSRRLRAPLVGGSVLAALVSAERLRGLPTGGVPWWSLLVLGMLLVLAVLRWGDFRGTGGRCRPLELALPLGPGTYVVAQGGPPALNQHADDPAQSAALDIVALGPLGLRCSPPAVYPGRLERYVVFDRPVLAPCAGRVVEAVDDVPDLEPPLRTPDRPPGNYVAIDADGTIVLLAHLRHGTVLVSEGDRVVAGQPLGCVGNSGNSSEPHLHIHAEQDGAGVPLVFPGTRRRPLRRNDTIGIGPRLSRPS